MNSVGKYLFLIYFLGMNLLSYAQSNLENNKIERRLQHVLNHSQELGKTYRQVLIELNHIGTILNHKWMLTQTEKDIYSAKLEIIDKQLQELEKEWGDVSGLKTFERIHKDIFGYKEKLENIWLINWQFLLISIILFLGVVGAFSLRLYMFFRAERHKHKFKEQKQIVYLQQDEIQKQKQEILSQREQLQLMTQQLAESSSYREILIKEVHHRVKNNLQNINSILNLQSDSLGELNALNLIKDIQSRVYSMALVYKISQQTEEYGYLDMQHYVKSLTDYLSTSCNLPQKNVTWEIEVQKMILDIDTATSVGLIINELISNAYKHAFSNQNEGIISLALRRIGSNRFELKIADNGIGLAQNFDLKHLKTIGLQLVQFLIIELEGSIVADNQDGASFTIFFKESSYPKLRGYKKYCKLQNA